MRRREVLASLGLLGTSGCLRLQQTGEASADTPTASPEGSDSSESADSGSGSGTESQDIETSEDQSVTLSEKWTEFKKSGYIWTAEGAFYFNQTNGAGAASPESGILWLTEHSQFGQPDGLIGGAFTVRDQQAVFGFRPDEDGSLETGAYYYAYDILTGDEMWSFETGEDGTHLVAEGATILDDTVVVGSSIPNSGNQDPLVYGVDAETGEQVWQIDTSILDNDYISEIAAHNDDLYVIQPGSGTYILDPATGSVVERVESMRAPPSGGYFHNETFYSPLPEQFIVYNLNEYTIQARGPGSGELRNRNPARPAVDDDLAVVGNRSGTVFAYDSDTGELLWETSLSEDIASVALSSSHVWVGGVSTITAYGREDGAQVHESTHDYRDRWGEGEIGVLDDTILIAGDNLTKSYDIEK